MTDGICHLCGLGLSQPRVLRQDGRITHLGCQQAEQAAIDQATPDEPIEDIGQSRQDRAALDAASVSFDLLTAITSDPAWEPRAERIRKASERAYDASPGAQQVVVGDRVLVETQSDEHLAEMDAREAADAEALKIVGEAYAPRSGTTLPRRRALAALIARAAISGPSAATAYAYAPDAPGGRAWFKATRYERLARAIQILVWTGSDRCSGCGTDDFPRVAWTYAGNHTRRLANGWCDACRADDYERERDRAALTMLFDVVRPVGRVAGPSRRSRAA